MAKRKSAATIKVQSQPSSSVVGGSATAKLAAAQKQAAIEAAAGIKSTVSASLKADARAEAAAAKKAESPISKPNVITRSGNTVFQNGSLVANYNDSATADAAVASMQTATGKGAIIGDNSGSTYRSIYKPAPVAIGSTPTVKNVLTPDTTTDTGSLTVPTTVTGDTTTDANGISRPIISTTAPTTAYGQTIGTTTDTTGTTSTSDYLTTAPTAPRSLQDIRQEELAQAQALIDATTALFNSEMIRLTNQGDAALGQTSAYAVGAGLAGSPFQTALENSQKNENTQAYQALSAQRSAEIASIMSDAEDDATAAYQAELDNYRADLEIYISERDKKLAAEAAATAAKKTAATSLITTLAEGGYSIDEIPKADYQQLLTDSGMSDFEARAVWAANTPAANATYTTQNGYLVGTYFDPITGKPVVTTTKLPAELSESAAPDIQTVTLADKSVIMYDAADPYNVDGSLKTISYKGSDISDSTIADTPTSYDEWALAGGEEGTGKTYAEYLQGSGLSTAQQTATFNSIVAKYNASPLIAAADRTPVLESSIAAIEADPGDATLQLNLAYSYIQALDTYQSAVREGELTNLNSIDSKLSALETKINKITSGKIVSESAALEIASAAKNILDTIKSAASQKAESFASQARVSGIGDMWSEYTSGFTPSYSDGDSGGASGIQFNQSYNSVADVLVDHPELQSQVEALSGDYSADEILQFFESEYGPQSFSSVGGDTNKAAITKLASVAKPGTSGGQCGAFVNDYTGLGMGDSYASKIAKTDPSIKVGQPGDVFVSPYDWTGHTGFIESVKPRTDGTYDYTVLDSNYGLNEKVQRHVINSAKVSGYARVPINV